MYIFFDFETSSKSFLGQILSYAFVVTDFQYNVVDTLQGFSKLNRIQLPDPEALLVNQLSVTDLQKNQNSDYETAHAMYRFLKHCVDRYDVCYLVGFNSASFDLPFLRTTLIRYGLNPYFRGRLIQKDGLHMVQHAAFSNPRTFPWRLVSKDKGPYYAFTLNEMSQAFELNASAQTHQAIDDVYLLISLIRTLEQRFGVSPDSFKGFHMQASAHQLNYEFGKLKQVDYSFSQPVPSYFETSYWVALPLKGKDKLFLNLNKFRELVQNADFSQESLLSCVKYINPNKHYFHLEPFSDSERQEWLPYIEQAFQMPFFKGLEPSVYFQLIAKPWDIEHLIHQLGFERIDVLYRVVEDLLKNPKGYDQQLRTLMAQKKDEKDTYLIQLFNRVYLNYHPDVPMAHFHRYVVPRYIEGKFEKNRDEFRPLAQTLAWIESELKTQVDPVLKNILLQCQSFTQHFATQFELL